MDDSKINKNSECRTGEFSSSQVKFENEIEFRELIRVIWKGKFIVLIVTAIFVLASVIFAINQPNIYKSEVLLVPAEHEGRGSLSGLAGQFGGLASLAGVSLDGGGGGKTQLALQILRSRQFTSAFIQKHKVLPELMASRSWSRETNKLNYDEEMFNAENSEWVRKVSAPFKPTPSMQEAYKVFSKLLSVSNDEDTGIVTLSIQHLSPYIAQKWVTWLVEDINLTMKERDVIEAEKSTVYLQRQLEQTNVADIREVLYRLIEEQTKTIMFANVRDEYVFKTIDAALVPEEKFKPNRALILILGAMFGGMFAVILVLVRYFASGS